MVSFFQEIRASIRRVRVKTDLVLASFFTGSILVYTILFIVPLLSIFLYARFFDWSLFTRPYYISFESSIPPIELRQLPSGVLFINIRGGNYGIILNSILNSVVVTAIAAVIGTSVALLVGVFEFPGRRLIAALSAIPLLIAPFVNSYVVLRIYGPGLQDNVLTLFLKSLGFNVKIAFSDLAGVTLAQILAFYPIVYINVLAAIGALDSTLIEQALNLGSRGFKLVRTIILPLIVPGILAGSTLVFILSLEDIAAPIVFKYYNMMSYQVYQFFQGTSRPDSPEGAEIAALSILLLVFAAAPLVVIRRYLSLRYYAKLARGAPRPLKRLKLGVVGKIVAYLAVLPVVVAAVAPQVGVVILAFSTKWTSTLPQEPTLANFVTIFTNPGIVRTITNSVVYASIAAILIGVLGFVSGYSVARSRLPGTSILDALSSLPLAVPGLVVAFSYLAFFYMVAKNTFFDPFLVPGSVLVLAYMIRKSPFTVRSVFTGVIQTPEELEEAAFSLGARRLRVIGGVLIPLVWRSIVAGLMLSTIYVLSEVSVSVTIGALGGSLASTTCAGPITFAILQLITMTAVHGGTQPQAQAAALAVILMVIEALVVFIAASRLARRGQALITV